MASKILAGRYEILERIGDGGMAVVYKAKCRLLNRFVAIKILKPEFINDVKFIESFRRESQAAASLSHPNIVNIYDVGKEGNIYYIVMELLEGDTLSDIIKREAPMNPKRVVTIAKQITSALSHAHKNNIIHRDVKPHNILMAPDGTAKITDFGIAKAINSGTIVNNTSTVMGSVHYLSPEQARGGYVDDKSDIYSMGIVMYEMLTGKVPFDGENAVSVAMMHMNNSVPAPSLEVPPIPEILDGIVLKATSKHQTERFKTAQDLYNALVNAGYEISSGRNSIVPAHMKSNSTEDHTKSISLDRGFTDDDEIPMGAEPTLISESDIIGQQSDDIKKDDVPYVSGKARKIKKKSGKKRIKVIAIVLALICAFPASYGIMKLMGGGETVTVPDLLGNTVEEAIEELSALGLGYKMGTDVYSDIYDVGHISSQKPEANEEVKEGYKVTLNISKGKSGDVNQGVPIPVPNLVGKMLSDAESILISYGFEKGTVTYKESDLPKDVIISHTPYAGQEAATSEKINLEVSEGKKVEIAIMPDLRGSTVDSAKIQLENLGLSLGTVATEHSTEYTENTIIEQEFPAGATVKLGASVSVKASLGPEIVQPVSVPFTISFSDAANEVFYLTVTITDNNGLRYIVNNQQRIKSDGSETLTLTGNGSGTVRVIFDDTLISENSVNFETGAVN